MLLFIYRLYFARHDHTPTNNVIDVGECQHKQKYYPIPKSSQFSPKDSQTLHIY